MTRRPVIGVTCCARTVGEETAQLVMHRYLAAVMRHADCAAVLTPACPELMLPSEVADRLDGLLLTGSPSNIDPSQYGDDRPGDGPFDHGRDAASLGLIAAMVDRGRPVLGVCRGFQELNVAFGGTLARDVGDGRCGLAHHAPDGVAFAAIFDHAHEVTLTPGGVLAQAFARDRLQVNSVHFQGVERLGDGLCVEATAPDGLVEAVSASVNGAAILGVQWHPEWQTDQDAASMGVFELFGRALRGETFDQGLTAT
jgi:putative glutamine amidotransferase